MMMWKSLKFSREKQQISSEEEEEEEEEERREEMQLSAALATRATTTTTSERREGEFFSSGNTSSLFFVRRRIRRSEKREAKTKKTTTTPRVGAFLFNNDDGEKNKKRTTSSRRTKTSSPKPKPLQQGDLTKKRCDACLGTGKIPCYNCTRRTSGWESGGNAVGGGGGVKAISVADKVGYVPAKRKTLRLFSLPFGWKTTSDKSGDSNKKKEEEDQALVRCPVCETCVPGKLVCGRCNGQGSLLYRSADWR
jgi:hypothetical protein